MSVATAIEALPEIGLKIASGIISAGIFNISIIGLIKFIITSNIPEALNAPTAKNIPINVGNMFITTSNPSFAPSKNVSYTLFFSITPYIIMINMTVGTAAEDFCSSNSCYSSCYCCYPYWYYYLCWIT